MPARDQPQHFRLELRCLVKLFLPRDALIKLVIRCRLGLGIEAAARRYLPRRWAASRCITAMASEAAVRTRQLAPPSTSAAGRWRVPAARRKPVGDRKAVLVAAGCQSHWRRWPPELTCPEADLVLAPATSFFKCPGPMRQ